MTASLAAEPAAEPAAAARAADVAEFVRAVRNELADLPALTVEELVGGLGADLTALVEDSGQPLRQVVADPAAYATELRLAADLPQRGTATRSRPRIADLLRNSAPIAALRADTPLRREVIAFCRVVVPAWWVVRGIAVASAANFLINTYGVALFLLYAVAVVASVQVGRRHRERHEPGDIRLDRGVDGVAAVLLVLMLPMIFHFLRWGFTGYGLYEPNVDQDLSAPVTGSGVFIDGAAAGNLFVYDSDGRLVRDARILDQEGRLLQLSDASGYADPLSGRSYVPAGYQGATGTSWGVFPLDVGVFDDGSFEYDVTNPQPAPLPALTLPALDTATATPDTPASADGPS